MAREGAGLATDTTRLVSSLFALIPIPVAIIDEGDRVILSNSAFVEHFPGIQNLHSLPQHELELPGRGTFDLETVPLNDQGMKMVYAANITNEVQLRRQVIHLEKMAAIGRLVSGVAHELNNPLAGILGYAQLVSRSELDPATRRMADVILAQAERAGKIVQNFLNLAAKTEIKRVGFDLNEAVRTVIELREYQDYVDDIEVKLDLCDALPRAWGDRHQIEQVLLNLIVNAEDAIADAQRRPGRIQIRSAFETGKLQIVVTDNGSGIHARDMSRIFDPFFTTKDRQRGTGLGLSICADIIKDHGGDLYAWSTYGSGSTFTMELPIRDDPEPEEILPVKTSAEQGLRGRSILVVDDEIHIAELMFDVLSRQGARIDVAISGIEALERLKKRTYDVIVCDQRMPGISGQRLYRLVESLNPDLQHRFLFVTGDVVNAQTKRFFMQDGVQFIRKPFRVQDLVEAIEGLISRTQLQGS